MASRIYELLEILAEELHHDERFVFTVRDLEGRDQVESGFVAELIAECEVAVADHAIPAAIKKLEAHFSEKGVSLPFSFDRTRSEFRRIDHDCVEFLSACSSTRSLGARSRDFEELITRRLSKTLPGKIHRVGAPRQKGMGNVKVNAHLKQHFGFKDDVLSGRDKDGGFDILWLVPLGADGYRSVFSIQCKNGKFRDEDAAKSVADAERSLHKHGGILDRGHVSCVVFNDYLEMSSQFKRGVSYIPVGISDLLRVSVPQDVQVL